MHAPTTRLHAYASRATTIVVDVDTDLTPGDLTDVTFEFSTTEKEGLSPVLGGNGLLVTVRLDGDDTDVTPGAYRWECRATFDGGVRTLATGLIDISPEPTPLASDDSS